MEAVLGEEACYSEMQVRFPAMIEPVDLVLEARILGTAADEVGAGEVEDNSAGPVVLETGLRTLRARIDQTDVNFESNLRLNRLYWRVDKLDTLVDSAAEDPADIVRAQNFLDVEAEESRADFVGSAAGKGRSALSGEGLGLCL
jgi:hypothetical protein